MISGIPENFWEFQFLIPECGRFISARIWKHSCGGSIGWHSIPVILPLPWRESLCTNHPVSAEASPAHAVAKSRLRRPTWPFPSHRAAHSLCSWSACPLGKNWQQRSLSSSAWARQALGLRHGLWKKVWKSPGVDAKNFGLLTLFH